MPPSGESCDLQPQHGDPPPVTCEWAGTPCNAWKKDAGHKYDGRVMTLTGCERQELEKEYEVFYEQGSNQLEIQ